MEVIINTKKEFGNCQHLLSTLKIGMLKTLD